MKPLSEIKANQRLIIDAAGPEGFCGTISLPLWRGSIICSTGAGWEHASVAPFEHRITPSWDDMCRIKDMIWREDEAVIQIHPAKADYVNMMRNCLHLWRCTYKEMVLPPSVLVGVRKGQTPNEVMEEVAEAYRIAEEQNERRPNGQH